MGLRGLDRSQLLAAVGFIAAVVVLAVQLITPSPVMVSLGGNGAETTQVGQYFTYADVWVIAASAVVCGATGAALLLGGPTTASDEPANDGRPAHSRSASAATNTTEPITDGAPGATDAVDPSDQQIAAWEDVADRLRDNEATLYTLLIEADGRLPQRELVAETDLSKATVSRTLDSLEQRNLVERKRRGMGNVVHLE